LVLVPNTLDFGVTLPPNPAEPPLAVDDMGASVAGGVMARAAGLRHWLVEDARSARHFLKRVAAHHALVVPLQQIVLRELPRPPKGAASRAVADAPTLDHLLEPLTLGHDLGVLSEAGLPGVADPGREVVAHAHARGFDVVVLPGASAITLAVAASGLSGQSFAFVGYLPVDATERRHRLVELEAASRRWDQTQVFIETPYRNGALLAAVLQAAQPATVLSVSMALATPLASTRCAPVQVWRRWAADASAATWLSDRLPAVFCLQAGRPERGRP
jgi:16S rRNA (cytidine1402-2'-O)-methyltransferase